MPSSEGAYLNLIRDPCPFHVDSDPQWPRNLPAATRYELDITLRSRCKKTPLTGLRFRLFAEDQPPAVFVISFKFLHQALRRVGLGKFAVLLE